jgi:flagellar basal-body rod protein FlgB
LPRIGSGQSGFPGFRKAPRSALLLLPEILMLDRMTAHLERYLDLLSDRQRLVASNLANIDTPGYQTRDIDFQFEFMSLVKGQEPQVVEVLDLAAKNDGNNVSLDRETRLLAETALRFNLASQLVRGQIRTLRNAIQEGKGV